MAVLKCMHARNGAVEYHTSIDRVSVVDWWSVPADSRDDPWAARPAVESGHRAYCVPNLIVTSSFQDVNPPQDRDQWSPVAMLVICKREGRPSFGVVCEQSSTYLMGDDGGTIDRL